LTETNHDRRNGTAPSPRSLVRKELLRAVGGLAAAPFRFGFDFMRHGSLERAFRGDLDAAAEPCEAARVELPDRPLRLFVSSAEHSGEAHAVQLVRRLRAEIEARGAPAPELFGLGGRRLADEGVTLVGDPVSRAAMGLDVLASLSFYREMLVDVARHLEDHGCDACVPIDSPALHVPLGHMARGLGIPVVHYITPQYWGWAPHRVSAYRKAVDLALTILPFEPSWFARHGVRTAHVGHPQLDVLSGVDAPRADAERTTLVLLPGSRSSVAARNLPWMLEVVALVRKELPDLEVVVPHDRPELEGELRALLAAGGAADSVRVAASDLHGELKRARIALSVSGTILLGLLHHRIPTVVIYRLDSWLLDAARARGVQAPWIASVNLLANREVLPEHCFRGAGPLEEVARTLLRFHPDGEERTRVRAGLDEAAGLLGPPGAAARAAGHVLATACAH
jgi:lipid-A-disaccharide synthase